MHQSIMQLCYHQTYKIQTTRDTDTLPLEASPPRKPPILVSKDEQISGLVPTVVKLQTCTSGCCSNRAAQFEFILGAVRLVWCHLFTIF